MPHTRRAARRTCPQLTLAWPGTGQICPRCHGPRQVFHRATARGVEIVGGKRTPRQATGGVRAPLAALAPDLPAARSDRADA